MRPRVCSGRIEGVTGRLSEGVLRTGGFVFTVGCIQDEINVKVTCKGYIEELREREYMCIGKRRAVLGFQIRFKTN